MKKTYRHVVVAASICTIIAAIAACSSGGNGGGGSSVNVAYTGIVSQSVISNQSVTATLTGLNSLVPICAATPPSEKTVDKGSPATLKAARLIMQFSATKQLGKRTAAATQPSDIPGNCVGAPGMITYKNWSHSNGTTTATLSFADYCITDPSTGNTETVLGDVPFVNAGTPSASGPVTTKLTANAPKLTMTKKSPANAVLETTSVGFAGFDFTPGTPGQLPTAAAPDSYKTSLAVIKNETTGKSTKIENLLIKTSVSATNDLTEQISGRVYFSDSGYVDIATDPVNPIIVNASGNHVSGKIDFTGANNTKATLTVVPGTVIAFTVDVNGTPLGTSLSCVDPRPAP